MELLSLVKLTDFAERMPGQLSGGQRQRVALMRALAPNPNVLLLDEPLSALDAKLRQQMQIELKSIQKTTGKTFIFVTHDQEEALTMSDVVVVMNAGRIEQMGTPIELYEKPATTFVATFIGSPSMNLIKPTGGSNANWPSDTATLGIRPEDLVIAETSPASGFRVKVQVMAVELVGAESYVHGMTEDGGTIVFRVPGRSVIAIGETLDLTALPDRFHLFDAEGKRLSP